MVGMRQLCWEADIVHSMKILLGYSGVGRYKL
jgi:hypothetical protein